MYFDKMEILCKVLVEKVKVFDFGLLDFIVLLVFGGLIFGYEIVWYLGVLVMWVECEDGEFCFCWFEFFKGVWVIVVEDIVIMGLFSCEMVILLKVFGVEVFVVVCLIDCFGGEVDVGVLVIVLVDYKVLVYEFDNFLFELVVILVVKLGSCGLS